ncbi:hypothetical protein EIP91_006929 [Steccherinum ochraceum]|uniref:Uncharacterized protein n=1 Tax=Steccherinum ochraceum TaxID=92696 RepID=A0A4R0R4X9_9APHY|nr:hypothetical protein EIP91_006929 [Steccherinum ochraceum]
MPAAAPVDARLLDKWDDPGLLRVHLQHTREPSPDLHMDLAVLKARAQILKARIRDLDDSRAQSSSSGNEALDIELAASRFKRKILLWLMFPINDLPPEILATIFHMVLNASETPMQAVLHRLHLTWVCGHWRHVAINDKLFWNVIWFRDRPPFPRSLAWIGRAGSAPLEIRIDEMKRRPEETVDPPKLKKEEVEELLDKLLVKVATIRTLVVVLGSWPAASAVLEKLRDAGTPASMERFELHRTMAHPTSSTPIVLADPDDDYEPLALCSGVAPRLRWLVLNGIPIDWHHSPLSNLTTLDLRRMAMHTSPSLTRWAEVLKSCPRLYRLSLDAAGPRLDQSSETPTIIEPVELSNLRDLYIGDVSAPYAKTVLSTFTAPGLTSLTLMNLISEDYGTVLEAITESYPLLRVLALYHVNVYRIDVNLFRVSRFLDSVPKLEYLKLSRCAQIVLECFLENPREYRRTPLLPVHREITAPTGREVMCPDLRYMSLHYQDMSQVLILTQGRQQLEKPLQKVYYLAANPDVNRQARQALQESVVEVSPLFEFVLQTPEEKKIHQEMLRSAGLARDPLYEDSW